MTASSQGDEPDRATEALLRQQVQDWSRAIVAKDIESVMAVYASSVVSFDLDPPLRYRGMKNKRRAWEQFFAASDGAISYEVTELGITAGADSAFVHSLNHVKRALANGQVHELWVRWTACFSRIDGHWRITHDHASVPADLAHGRAVLDLVP